MLLGRYSARRYVPFTKSPTLSLHAASVRVAAGEVAACLIPRDGLTDLLRWRTRAELADRAVRFRHLTRAYQLVMLTRAFDGREA
jgi:hypothetical protein